MNLPKAKQLNVRALITPLTTQLGLGTIGNTGQVLPNLTTGNNLNNLTTQQKIDILFNS